MNKEDAINYINYAIKNYGFDESTVDGLNDEEIIKLADEMESRADAAYDAWKEREI